VPLIFLMNRVTDKILPAGHPFPGDKHLSDTNRFAFKLAIRRILCYKISKRPLKFALCMSRRTPLSRHRLLLPLSVRDARTPRQRKFPDQANGR
jgi:hypothetical protein